ncbi:hypothetical protein ACFW7K_14825 [Streptomyces sp. NPDC058735]|uniref:hypothetical protein n=1 Tax=Streptomyces sp. NPDC058735 TaxID=3346616 RepID=UPI00367C8F44
MVALAVAAVLSLRRREVRPRRPLAAVTVAPLGLFDYLAWVNHHMGDLNGYPKLQDGARAQRFDWGVHTVDVLTSTPVGHFDHPFAMPFEDVIGVCMRWRRRC